MFCPNAQFHMMFLAKYSLSPPCACPNSVIVTCQAAKTEGGPERRFSYRGLSQLVPGYSEGSLEADDGCCYPQCHLMPECCIGVSEGAGHGHAHSNACRERKQPNIQSQNTSPCTACFLHSQHLPNLLTRGMKWVLQI